MPCASIFNSLGCLAQMPHPLATMHPTRRTNGTTDSACLKLYKAWADPVVTHASKKIRVLHGHGLAKPNRQNVLKRKRPSPQKVFAFLSASFSLNKSPFNLINKSSSRNVAGHQQSKTTYKQIKVCVLISQVRCADMPAARRKNIVCLFSGSTNQHRQTSPAHERMLYHLDVFKSLVNACEHDHVYSVCVSNCKESAMLAEQSELVFSI